MMDHSFITYAVVDERAPEALCKMLEADGFRLIRLPCFPLLSEPVCGHPDMVIFPLGDTVFCHCDYFPIASKALSPLVGAGYSLRTVDDPVSSYYPEEAQLNLLTVGNFLFANPKSAARLLLTEGEKAGFTRVSVRQGYTRCSVCRVSDDAIITADRGIARAAEAHGLSCLLIRPGHILLPGVSYGLIGGTGGLCRDTVWFSGDLSAHPDGEAIAGFCAAHGKKVRYPADEPLLDIGSIFFL